MPDDAQVTCAVLKALLSTFRGMARAAIISAISVELGEVIHGTKMHRLLPKIRTDGLIRSDKSTWFITDKGKEFAADAAKVGISLFVSLLHPCLIPLGSHATGD